MTGRRADPRFHVATLALVGYVLAAAGAGNVYPVSTFPMYSGAAGEAVSRVMARDAGGAFVEVTDLEGWRCDGAVPALEATTCGDARGIAYLDRERDAHIRAHAAASGGGGSGGNGSGEPFELVRRVFSFDGVERPAYCPIARCTARRQ
jgi:hypothetical protein